MRGVELPYPGGSSGGSVPMSLYLSDRDALYTRFDRLESKVDILVENAARDDGEDVAEKAAATAVVESRRSRREIWRDVGLCVLSAVLACAGTVLAAVIAAHAGIGGIS